MEAASVCMGLLAMAQTDQATSELPRGPERSAMFVQKAEEYFKGLNVSWGCEIMTGSVDRSTDRRSRAASGRALLVYGRRRLP